MLLSEYYLSFFPSDPRETDFVKRFSGELDLLTGGIPVIGEMAVTPIDIASLMISSGENYSSVFQKITEYHTKNLITGTTKPTTSLVGEVSSGHDLSAKYSGLAKT